MSKPAAKRALLNVGEWPLTGGRFAPCLWHRMRTLTFIVALMLVGMRFFADASEGFSKPDIRTAADSVVTFNEIMYHPAGDDPALEWIELYNQMSVDIDLSDWRIEGGIDFRFPADTILLANSYLVVASDPAALQAQAGGIPVLATGRPGPWQQMVPAVRLQKGNDSAPAVVLKTGG